MLGQVAEGRVLAETLLQLIQWDSRVSQASRETLSLQHVLYLEFISHYLKTQREQKHTHTHTQGRAQTTTKAAQENTQ